MIPDADLVSNEVVRPFVIMQPQFTVHEEQKSRKKKGHGFNPRCDPPNSIEFFKEMNGKALEKYNDLLIASDALRSEM